MDYAFLLVTLKRLQDIRSWWQKAVLNWVFYYQGIMHDMSKYSPTEFLVGVKYYQGTASPNNAERMEKGISMSWLHHKGRNKHHFEYWIDYSIDKDHPGLVGMKIPKKYMAEMFVDRVSAGKIYNGDEFDQKSPLEYFEHGIGASIMCEASRDYLLNLLRMYAEKVKNIRLPT